MRRNRRSSAIKMTFVAAIWVVGMSAGADSESEFGNMDVTSCSVELPRESAYDWFKGLQSSIEENSGITPEGRAEPTASAIPVPVAEEPGDSTDIDQALTRAEPDDLEREPDEKPSDRYDLPEPLLGNLRSAARNEANAKRERSVRSKHGGWRKIFYRANQPWRSKFLCYQAVKDALVKTGMTRRRLPHVPAKWAHQKGALKAEGFENLLETEKGAGYTAGNAPLGSVLVYDGGRKKCERDSISCGHIEIKLNAAEYCSDYCKSIPINRYLNRKLIGVYVKSQK